MGHYILSVVDCSRSPSRSLSYPEVSASFFATVRKAGGLSDGGLHLPYTPDGLYHFEPPHTFAACKAGAIGGAEICRLADSTKIAIGVPRKLGNMHSITCVDEVLAQRGVRRAFD